MKSYRRIRILLLSFLVGFCLFDALMAYPLPFIQDRIGWRLQVAEGQLRGWLYPHPELIATPDLREAADAQTTNPPQRDSALSHSDGTPAFTERTSSIAENSPAAATLAAASEPPLPEVADLPFNRHEWQKWNNCGPASLSMQLAFWGWQGSQDDTAAYLKPNTNDKNVTPWEMRDFVRTQTGFDAIVRTGGTLELLRRLIAAGFPVIIERGFEIPEEDSGWMGHYTLFTGYDHPAETFLSQDAFRGPRYRWTYPDVASNWRAFNYSYLVIFPIHREADVHAVLASQADEAANRQYSLHASLLEIGSLHGPPLAYAWFNLGTNLTASGDFSHAASAYDQARVIGLPWRFLWYQFGPYAAYYQTGRYSDILTLTAATIEQTPHVEEAWYWRGMARAALGNRNGAVDDWRMAVVRHPGYAPAIRELEQSGGLTQ